MFTILKDLAYSQLWHLEAGEEEEKNITSFILL